jgi:hypothetical protein
MVVAAVIAIRAPMKINTVIPSSTMALYGKIKMKILHLYRKIALPDRIRRDNMRNS